MSLDTNLAGRLRNTSLPLTSGMLPLFEAVVNSIHAIEEKKVPMDEGLVRVEILRKAKDSELDLEEIKRRGPEARGEIVGFKISDNGVGFNDENMKSFHTLDSDHKVLKGGRGVGRLLWLKAFKVVKVTSFFVGEDSVLKKRNFTFDALSGVSDEVTADTDDQSSTGSLIELDGFNSKYRAYARRTGKAITEAIVEHCLWYFLRPGGAPDIRVEDDGDVFMLADGFEEHMHSAPTPETIQIKGREFELVHAKLRSNSISAHSVAFCADQRVVEEEKLAGRVPGLYGRINDGSEEFIYSCYVCSRYLDENVRSERTGFDIPDSVEELLEKTEISLSDIRNAVVTCAEAQLKDYLSLNKEKSKERVAKFVATTAPRYRPILSRIPEDQLNVDPDISDKDLDLALHKHFAVLESELLAEGHDIMAASPSDDFADYEARLRDYLSKAEDIKKSDLASYVSHRRVILDLFEKATQRDSEGKYVREELIHQLIMPMRVDSNSAPLNAGNLWLIDERLAFHDYLASDKPLSSMPITGSSHTKEPDLCVLNFFDQPVLFSDSGKLPPASLEIIEIKRPLRNDAAQGEEKDPIEQAIGYLDRIRAGGVRTANGRLIPSSDNTPGFCYILADLTPTLVTRCERVHDLTRTADGMGYFGYKKNSQAYIEVIGFDRLLTMSKERNKAFFDKLGLPAT
jgi:hypothetical protein